MITTHIEVTWLEPNDEDDIISAIDLEIAKVAIVEVCNLLGLNVEDKECH